MLGNVKAVLKPSWSEGVCECRNEGLMFGTTVLSDVPFLSFSNTF